MTGPEALTPKKLFIRVSLLILFGVFIWFVLSYNWLTVESTGSNETKLINIKRPGDDGEVIKSFELNKKKTVLVKRGTYTLEVSNEGKLSLYKRSLGYFSSKISVELEPQKASNFLGVNALPCVKEKQSELLFSSCSPYAENSIVFSNTRGFLTSQPTDTTTGEESHENPTAGVLKSYGEGYLSVGVRDKNLIIATRGTSNDRSLTLPSSIKNVAQEGFSTSPDSENFAVYDNESNEILNFKNVTDKNPAHIKLPEDRRNPGLLNRVVASKDYIYLLGSPNTDIHEGHDGEESNHSDETAEKKPSILVYSAATNTLIKEHAMPDSWDVREASNGPDSQLILTLDNPAENIFGVLNRLSGTVSPDEITSIANNPQDVCWKDGDSFFYLSDFGKSIYRYSLSRQASFLVYGGLNDQIISYIRCDGGELYVVFDRTAGRHRASQEYAGYHHYKIADDSIFTGKRLEAVLPAYTPVGEDVVEAKLTRESIVISVWHQGDGNLATPSQQTAQAAVIENLREQGVNTENIKFTFAF